MTPPPADGEKNSIEMKILFKDRYINYFPRVILYIIRFVSKESVAPVNYPKLNKEQSMRFHSLVSGWLKLERDHARHEMKS